MFIDLEVAFKKEDDSGQQSNGKRIVPADVVEDDGDDDVDEKGERVLLGEIRRLKCICWSFLCNGKKLPIEYSAAA